MKKTYILIFTILFLNACNKAKINKYDFNKTIKNNNNSTVVKIDDEVNDIMFLSTIYFDFDSHLLGEKEKQNIELLSRYLKKNKEKTITLYGYCDQIGEEQYNYKLGLQRSIAVKKYLKKLGIDEIRISTISYGKKFDRKVVIIINN